MVIEGVSLHPTHATESTTTLSFTPVCLMDLYDIMGQSNEQTFSLKWSITVANEKTKKLKKRGIETLGMGLGTKKINVALKAQRF